MEVKILVEQIHNLYKEAKNSKYQHDRIFRGEGRSISSEMEDLFASFLIDKLPTNTSLFINQTITTGTKETRIRIKPDIVVVRDNTIKSIIDLKMDLGYKRNEFGEFWDARDSQMSELYNKVFSLNKKDKGVETKLELVFSKNAKLFFIVVSDKNINEAQLGEIKSRIGKKINSEVYFLFEGVHPNSTKTSIDELILNVAKTEKVISEFLFELNKTL